MLEEMVRTSWDGYFTVGDRKSRFNGVKEKKKTQNDKTQLVSVQKHEAAGSESGHREQGQEFGGFFCICCICN